MVSMPPAKKSRNESFIVPPSVSCLLLKLQHSSSRAEALGVKSLSLPVPCPRSLTGLAALCDSGCCGSVAIAVK